MDQVYKVSDDIELDDLNSRTPRTVDVCLSITNFASATA